MFSKKGSMGSKRRRKKNKRKKVDIPAAPPPVGSPVPTYTSTSQKKILNKTMCGGRGNLYNQHDFGNVWTEPSCYRRSDPLEACGGRRKTFVAVGLAVAVAATTVVCGAMMLASFA